MSLNWREIDLVLSELDLAGAKIERVLQPSFDSISLGLYRPGRPIELFISVAQGACRLHSLSQAPPKPARPLRFMECLRSRLRGGRIDAATQLGMERVIRLDISVRREDADAKDEPLEGGPGEVADWSVILHYRLYARLWSGAGNIILVDGDGMVVDAIARRPRRGEVSGQRCTIEEDLAADAAARPSAPRKDFLPRELPGEGTFNQKVEAQYSAQGGELSRDHLLGTARERFRKRSLSLESRISALESRVAEFRDAERLRQLGDILMANPAVVYQGKYADCQDFFEGGETSIPIDPGLSPVDNARRYYERHRKAKSGLADVEAELEGAHAALERERTELASIEAEEDPFLMARALEKGGTVSTVERREYPGFSLERSGWTILVGRSASENDELLRRHVRGSDLWLHARDWAGSYVFIKSRKGKSVPLDILLDAGTLAIYYSKGRANGAGDVYYTFVKYLRRAKDGPKGLVIPMQEKNLRVKIDDSRIKALRSLIGAETGT